VSAVSSQVSGPTISTTGSVDPVRYSSHDAAVTSDTEKILTIKNGKSMSATSRVQRASSERDRIVKYVTKIICKIIVISYSESRIHPISPVQIPPIYCRYIIYCIHWSRSLYNTDLQPLHDILDLISRDRMPSRIVLQCRLESDISDELTGITLSSVPCPMKTRFLLYFH
jgi:hypothetical protein